MDDHHVGIAHRLPLRLDGEVADADTLVQHQLADVDLDVLRNVGREALDLDLAANELEETALLLHALGLAFDDDRDGHPKDAVHDHAVEIRVQHVVRNRVELVFLDQDAGVARARQLQRDERVGPRVGVKDFQERLRLDRDRRRRVVLAAVQHPRHPAGPTRPPRLVFPQCVARDGLEYRFHNYSQ